MFLKACSASRGAGVELACSPIAERAESVLVRPATAITAIAEAQASIRADQGFIIDPSFMDCCLRTRWPFRAQSSIIRGRAARHVRSDASMRIATAFELFAGSEWDFELEFGLLAPTHGWPMSNAGSAP